MAQHDRFISTPLTEVLDYKIGAYAALSPSISTTGIIDGLGDQLFLEAWGFLEQKCKCLLWDTATIDYNLRYTRFNVSSKYSQMSTYEEKNNLFSDLKTKCLELDSGKKATELCRKDTVLSDSVQFILELNLSPLSVTIHSPILAKAP